MLTAFCQNCKGSHLPNINFLNNESKIKHHKKRPVQSIYIG
jgi:hypothetical protein